jgi:phage terminase small subunit
MAKNKKENLTDKQERFCQEYIIDLNGTQAAIRAGYSEKTSGAIAEQNLKKLEIQERVQQLQQKIQERVEITADNVVKELAKIGFMDIGELYDEDGNIKKIGDLSVKAKASISSVKVTEKSYGRDDNETFEKTIEMKLWDKGKALVELGRHLGIFEKDNNQVKPEPFKIIIN